MHFALGYPFGWFEDCAVFRCCFASVIRCSITSFCGKLGLSLRSLSQAATAPFTSCLPCHFAGGIIDGIFGYSGFLMLQKGQTGNVIELRTGAQKQLPFAIKCYSAGQENYADGSPKRWWSKLAVVQDGKEIESKEIVVNDPLVHQGLRFYQASYGPTGKLDGLTLQATPDGGSAREITLQADQPLDLDPTTSMTLAEYIPDFFIRDNQVFKRSDDPVNPAFRLQVKNKATGEDAKLWLFPAYGETAQGEKTNYSFAYGDMQMGYFTGLEVSHEPGQWLVWGGVLLMCAGLGVAFYMVHMRLWIVAIPDAQGKLVLWRRGSANKPIKIATASNRSSTTWSRVSGANWNASRLYRGLLAKNNLN